MDMQNIIYVWVNNFACFKEKPAEYNLSSFYSTKFDYEKKLLSICETENMNVMSFLFGDNNVISDYAIVVGENGSGKTTLFRFLFDILQGRQFEKTKYLILFKFDKGTSNPEFGYLSNINQITSNKHCTQIKELFSIAWQRTLIYYSPVFAAMHQIIPLGDFRDISTTYLLKKDVEKYCNTLSNTDCSMSQVEAHLRMDNSRVVKFLMSKEYKKLGKIEGLILPTHISVKAREIETIIDNDILTRRNDDGELGRLIDNVKLWLEKHNNLLNRIYSALFLEYISMYYKPDSDVDHQRFSKAILDALDSAKMRDTDFQLNIDVFFNHLITCVNKEFETPSYDINNIENIKLFLQKAKDIFNSIEGNDKEKLCFSIKDLTTNDEAFFDSYFKIGVIKDFLVFGFYPYLSTGEYLYLTFFSRVYECFISSIKDYQSKFTFFLDEFETTLHPSLQRSAVYCIASFLNQLITIAFPNKRVSIQLIFASHSPMLLSDFQECSVTRLKKGGNQGTNTRSKVFAANIYDLYKDSFFLNFPTGELSKRLIQKAIETSDERIVKMVADPILRNMIKATIAHKTKKANTEKV